MVELGICKNEGKGNSELRLLRKLWNILKPVDVLLSDRYMCAWTELVMLKQRGVDSVTRLHHLRKIDFRRGKHLGPGDHIVEWPKPRKPHSIDQETMQMDILRCKTPELVRKEIWTYILG